MNHETQIDEKLIEELIKRFDERYVQRRLTNIKSTEETQKKKRKISTLIQLDEFPQYLLVPYEKRDEVKTAGAWWDAEKKLWFIPDQFKGDKSVFDKYRKFIKVGDEYTLDESVQLP